MEIILKAVRIFQLVSAILLVGAILLQHRGTGLGGALGGEGNVYRSRRGIEKTLFASTIILTFLFVVSAVVALVLQR